MKATWEGLTAVEQYELKIEGIIHQMRNPYYAHFVNPEKHNDLLTQLKNAEDWLQYFKDIEESRKKDISIF